MADGAASAEVAADADPAENRDPEADCWLNTVQHLLTQRHRRCQSDASDKIIRPEAEKMAQGWCNKSCVRGCGGCVRGRGRAACVDVAGIPHRRWQDRLRDKSIQCDYFFFNGVKEDIK